MNRLETLLAVVVLSLGCTSLVLAYRVLQFAPPEQQMEHLLNAAVHAQMHSRDLNQAKRLYSSALSQAEKSNNRLLVPRVLNKAVPVYIESGELTTAEAMLRRALGYYNLILDNSKSALVEDTTVKTETVSTMLQLGRLLKKEQRNEEATQLLNRALKLNAECLTSFELEQQLRKELGAAAIHLTHQSLLTMQMPPALEKISSDTDWQKRLSLGIDKLKRGELLEAKEIFRQCQTVAQTSGKGGHIADAFNWLAQCDLALGQTKAARNDAQQAIQSQQKNTARDVEFTMRQSASLMVLSKCAGRENRKDESESSLREAIALNLNQLSTMEQSARNKDLVGKTAVYMANSYRAADENILAAEILERSLPYLEKTETRQELLESMDFITDSYLDQYGLARFEPILQRTLALYDKIHGVDSLKKVQRIGRLADKLSAGGYFDKAERFYKQILPVLERKKGVSKLEVTDVVEKIGEMCRAQSHLGEAEAYFKRAEPSWRKLDNANALRLDLLRQGHTLMALGKLPEAEKYFRECIRLQKEKENLIGLLELLGYLSICLNRQNKQHELDLVIVRCLELHAQIIWQWKTGGELNLQRVTQEETAAASFLARLATLPYSPPPVLFSKAKSFIDAVQSGQNELAPTRAPAVRLMFVDVLLRHQKLDLAAEEVLTAAGELSKSSPPPQSPLYQTMWIRLSDLERALRSSNSAAADSLLQDVSKLKQPLVAASGLAILGDRAFFRERVAEAVGLLEKEVALLQGQTSALAQGLRYRAYSDLTFCFMKQNKLKESLETAHGAEENSPNEECRYHALVALGRVHLQRGEHELSRTYFERAINICATTKLPCEQSCFDYYATACGGKLPAMALSMRQRFLKTGKLR